MPTIDENAFAGQLDAPAEGPCGPEFAGHGLVDNGNGRGDVAVQIGEGAAGEDRDTGGLHVGGIDGVHDGADSVVFGALLAAFDLECR